VKKTYTSVLHRNVIIMLIVAIILVTGVWFVHDYRTFRHDSEHVRTEHIESSKEMITEQVQRAIDYINFRKAAERQRTETQLTARVESAMSMASHLYERHSNCESADELKQIIIDAIDSAQVDDGRGHYFVMDLTGMMRAGPAGPQLVNTNVLDFKDSAGRFVFADMIDIVKTHGSGFSRYMFKRRADTENFEQRLSYVALFKPLNLVIGSSKYLADTIRDTQRRVIERLSRIRFADGEGYIFVCTADGTSLVNAVRPDLVGHSVLDVVDDNGVKFVQELIHAAGTPEDEFVEYMWARPSTGVTTGKISFAREITDWQWIVGAGLYMDDIEEVIAAKSADLKERMVNGLALVFAIFASLLLVSLLLSRAKRLSIPF